MGGPGSGRKKGSGKSADPMLDKIKKRNAAQDKTYAAMKSGKAKSAYSVGGLKRAAKKQKMYTDKNGQTYMG